MRIQYLVTFAALALTSALSAAPERTPTRESAIPRTADGKPNLQGIWQAASTASADLQDHAASLNMLAGRSVLAGGAAIPYQPWAAAKRAENFQNRLTDDPLNQCYMPGTPRIMYMDFPFQIFQTPSGDRHDVRVVADSPADLHRWQPASERRHRGLDG